MNTKFWTPGPKLTQDHRPRWTETIGDALACLPWWFRSLLYFAAFLGLLAAWWWVSGMMRSTP